MTSTQKFSGFTIVPWFNTAEWKLVYNRIYEESTTLDNQREALATIHMWKIRMNLLPSGIEGTLWILEALLTDTTRLSDLMVSALYGSSIMRFLNLCVASRADVFNFTKTAKLHQIPDWIIEIRHDFAHSYKLPSQYVLKLALNECLKWLKNNYWLPEMEVMSDYVVPKTCSQKVDVEEAIIFYGDLIVLCINDGELDTHKDVKLELKKLDVQVTDKNWMDITRQVFEIIEPNCGYIKKDCWQRIFMSLIESGCFFIQSDEISKHQYQLIENLIILVHRQNALADLIIQLVFTANDAFTLERNKESVSLWLNDIFIGLLNQQGNIDLNDCIGKGISFRKGDPNTFTDLEYVASYILWDVNKTTKNFIRSFMLFYENVSDKTSSEYIKNLEKMTTFIHYDPESNEDMKDLKECADISLIMECSYINGTFEDITMDTSLSKKGWITDLDVDEYKSCAIGILPHQK